MSPRTHLHEEPDAIRALRVAAEKADPVAPDAAFTAAARDQGPGRGAAPAVARAIDGLHSTAGNGAVAWLLGGGAARRHREGPATVHAGHTAVAGGPVVQRGPDDEKPADANAAKPATAADATTDAAGGNPAPVRTDGASDGTDGAPLGGGAPTPGPSWTKVGPPSNTTYTVSGSLRTVANAIAARTEAGSVTATPSQDTETYAPDGGTEKVTAARVTVAQAMELPSWSDKSTATVNQQAEWDRFFAAITTHENGHVTTDQAAYAGVHSKMLGQTQADADKKLDAAEATATADNTTYDTGNDHGLKQGTGINANIDEVTKVP